MAPATTSMFTNLLYLSATAYALKHAHAPKDLGRSGDLTRSPTVSPAMSLNKRSLSSNSFATCYTQQSCAECFGSGHVGCPAGSFYDCYDPSEGSVAELCDVGSLSSSTLVPTATAPSAPLVSTDTCRGLSCSECFGSAYVACPPGSYFDCTKVNDPDSICNLPGSSASTTASAPVASSTCSSSISSDADCACNYGPENVLCSSDSCYDPTIGESCCDDGGYCAADEGTCSAVDGYCCSGSSDTSPGCQGASGTSSALLFQTTTRSSFAYPTSSAATSSVGSEDLATAAGGSSQASATSDGATEGGNAASSLSANIVRLAGLEGLLAVGAVALLL